MFVLRRPLDTQLAPWLAAQSEHDFNYAAVGATATSPPVGFVRDHNRTQLGTGADCFRAGQQALRAWTQLKLGWVAAWPATTSLEVGQTVAVVAHSLGLWSVNPTRIVYVIDAAGPTARFGFAYGTLPGHVAEGEERFLIEWNAADDSVWYDILAYSRPRHLLARVGYPWLRHVQKRFARESMAAMRNAVARPLHNTAVP